MKYDVILEHYVDELNKYEGDNITDYSEWVGNIVLDSDYDVRCISRCIKKGIDLHRIMPVLKYCGFVTNAFIDCLFAGIDPEKHLEPYLKCGDVSSFVIEKICCILLKYNIDIVKHLSKVLPSLEEINNLPNSLEYYAEYIASYAHNDNIGFELFVNSEKYGIKNPRDIHLLSIMTDDIDHSEIGDFMRSGNKNPIKLYRMHCLNIPLERYDEYTDNQVGNMMEYKIAFEDSTMEELESIKDIHNIRNYILLRKHGIDSIKYANNDYVGWMHASDKVNIFKDYDYIGGGDSNNDVTLREICDKYSGFTVEYLKEHNFDYSSTSIKQLNDMILQKLSWLDIKIV